MDTNTHDTQLTAVLTRLDTLTGQVALLVARQRKQDELLDELVLPVAKEVLKSATGHLEAYEKKGYFAFARELAKVGDRIVTSYSPEDVRQLGEAITGILDTVRAMTRPEVLAVAGEVSGVLAKSDSTEPLGLVGMVRATRDDDVQRGMAVMMEVLRKVGKGAAAMADRQDSSASRKERLAAVLGPRRGAKVLGVERPPAPRAPAVHVKAPADLPPPAGCAVPSTRTPAVAAVIDGVAFGADGHLVDPTQWTEALAQTLAQSQSVTLTDQHWAIVKFARGDWEKTKASPNVRRITLGTGLATKDLYTLFPKAPGRTIAKIAGIPKPAGCL